MATARNWPGRVSAPRLKRRFFGQTARDLSGAPPAGALIMRHHRPELGLILAAEEVITLLEFADSGGGSGTVIVPGIDPGFRRQGQYALVDTAI